MDYLCAACGEIVSIEAGITILDAGLTLTCPQCGGDTVIDLSTPETRAEPYRLVEELSKAAGFAGTVDAETMKARVDELHGRISLLMDEVALWKERARIE